MKSWLSAITQPDRRPGLYHSPSTKPPQSREVWLDKVVTKLLGLLGPTKPDMRLAQIKACPPAGATSLEPWNIHGPLPTLSFWVLHFPLFAPFGHTNKQEPKLLLIISIIAF
jgi:hypothetical protein